MRAKLWICLKVGFLLTSLFFLLLVVSAIIGGDRPNTRRASVGLIALPMFSLFYLFSFHRIRPSILAVAGHLVAIASTAYIAACIYLHHARASEFHVTESPFLILLCVAILGYGASFGMIAYSAGYFPKPRADPPQRPDRAIGNLPGVKLPNSDAPEERTSACSPTSDPRGVEN